MHIDNVIVEEMSLVSDKQNVKLRIPIPYEICTPCFVLIYKMQIFEQNITRLMILQIEQTVWWNI